MAVEKATTQPPLTPQLVEQLAEGEYSDAAAPGLFLRVNKKSRTFRWYARSVGRAITIGRWSRGPKPGHVTLAEARVWLDKLRDAHRAGTLDQVVKELERLHPRRRVDPKPPAELTIASLAEEFLKHLEVERRRPEQARRILEVELIPVLGSKAYPAITKDHITELIRGISGRDAPVMANATYTLVKQLFVWVADTHAGLVAPDFPRRRAVGARKAARRERVLSLEEVGLFWNAIERCPRFTPLVRDALRLLLLLGVRAGELRQATWDEMDLEAGVWTIPEAHQKQPQGPWRVPLGPRTVEILKGMQVMAKSIGSNHVLASWANDGLPLSDKSMNHAMRRLLTEEPGRLVLEGKRPVPHDLRRTVRYHARETLKVPFDVAEKMLAHSLGEIPSIYDPGDLFEERKAAIIKWERVVQKQAKVDPTLTPQERAAKANMVKYRAQRAAQEEQRAAAAAAAGAAGGKPSPRPTRAPTQAPKTLQ